jgi:hypothetical protein
VADVRYVIVAKSAEADALYFAWRQLQTQFTFRLLASARKRMRGGDPEKSIHCRRLLETGARLSVVKIGSSGEN